MRRIIEFINEWWILFITIIVVIVLGISLIISNDKVAEKTNQNENIYNMENKI